MRFTAFRFTVDPTPVQRSVLARHVGAARFGYNQCLTFVKQASDARARDASFDVAWSDQCVQRVEAVGRVIVVDPARVATVVATGLPWRPDVHQQVFEEASVDLGRALAAFSEARRSGRRVGFPRFRPKTAPVGSFRIRTRTSAGVGSIRVGEGAPRSVTLPRIGVLRVREDTRRLRRMVALDRARIVSATVTFGAGTGRWTISIIVQAADRHPATRHPSTPNGDHGGWVGVDQGLSALVVAATADGRQLLRVDDQPRPLRAGMARLRRLSRQVSRKQRGSVNRREATARLARHHAHIRNIRHEFLHQVARQLVTTPRPARAGRPQHHRHDRLPPTCNCDQRRRLGKVGIDYQQAWRGGQLVYADRWYPSSKTCSRCGTITPSLALSTRTYSCAVCGLELDRDLNAAVNLATWPEHHGQIRDPQAGGPVTNAHQGDGAGPQQPVGESGPNDVGTPPPHPGVLAGTSEKDGVA